MCLGSILELARILSSIVQDMTDANGSITIRKRNICSDSVRLGDIFKLFINYLNITIYIILFIPNYRLLITIGGNREMDQLYMTKIK